MDTQSRRPRWLLPKLGLVLFVALALMIAQGCSANRTQPAASLAPTPAADLNFSSSTQSSTSQPLATPAQAAMRQAPALSESQFNGYMAGPGYTPESQSRPTQQSADHALQATPSSLSEPVQSNPFVSTGQDHLSTFALDVDTGSYTAARNYIGAGVLPPPHTVRTEEFVNYFRYDYPAPENDTFSIYVDGAPSPYGKGDTHIVRVGIQGKRINDSQRKDAVLTFVIDISGSMEQPNRLPLVKDALKLLLNELRPTDQVGIVVYGSDARLVLEHTSVAERDRIVQAIDSLQNEGSTNAEAGLLMGYRLADKHFRPDATNRIILCSDGVANVGATSPEAIRETVRNFSKQGIYLTTVGFGMGDYNDYLMEQLADDGDGTYAYVDTLREARRIFGENLTGTLQVIAKDAKVQVEFNPSVVSRYRLLGYENRDVADDDFRNDVVDAGEIGAGHTVTVLYEVEVAGAGDGPALTVQMRYAEPLTGEVKEMRQPFRAGDMSPGFQAATPRFQLAVAVAGFAEQLKMNGEAQGYTLADVYSILQRISPQLSTDEDVQELAQLVAQASAIPRP